MSDTTRHDNTTGTPTDGADQRDTTDTTERDSATDTGAWLTVVDAARVLGISPGAVRKRIERGQLEAQKVSGQWVIAVPNATETAPDTRHDTTRQDATRRDSTTAPILPAVAYAQLEAIRDEWLAPLVERIGELEREAGRLTAERDALERERDQLRQRVEDRAAAPDSDSPASDLWGLLKLRREHKRQSDDLRREIAELREALERGQSTPATRDTESPAPAPETPHRRSWRVWEAFRRRP